MRTLLTLTILAASSICLARPAGKFFANPVTQAKAPLAFAIQEAAVPALPELEKSSAEDREALVAAISADPVLSAAVNKWETLSSDAQLPHLQAIFELEWRLIGGKFRRPELILNHPTFQKSTYFDFDVTKPDAGKVYINTKMLAEDANKHAALLFLIHETRHSVQFQLAFSGATTKLAQGYEAAFRAQKQLKDFTFCDFTILLNEYDAFQFANYVVGKLTHWKVDTLEMGTFASQFHEHGKPRINLIQLASEVGPAGLFKAFNDLEKEQFDLMEGH